MVDYTNASKEFGKALLALDRVASNEILASLATNSDPFEIIERIVVPALEEIGAGWEVGEIALSQVYMGGRMCEELVNQLLPPDGQGRKDLPRIGIATLSDYHLLGKKIVYSTVRSAGYDLKDFGQVQSPRELADLAATEEIQVLLVSTLMLRSALSIKELTAILRTELPHVKTIVGGAPFIYDSELWKTVGADMMCTAASEVLAAISKLTGA